MRAGLKVTRSSIIKNQLRSPRNKKLLGHHLPSLSQLFPHILFLTWLLQSIRHSKILGLMPFNLTKATFHTSKAKLKLFPCRPSKKIHVISKIIYVIIKKLFLWLSVFSKTRREKKKINWTWWQDSKISPFSMERLRKLAGTHNQNFFTSPTDEYTIDPQHSFRMVKTTSVAL